ncbi:MAG: hypothetical protein LC795_11385 [Acidobacteria bacterium]|nr:hypothetical protein [Acidobacteriota bacterium]MCA1619893.1 hypothetical protein [Acidobacteriota bacterium]
MRILLCLALLAHALPATAAQRRARPSAHAPTAADVYAVVDEVDRIAARAALWPGFDPRRVPLAIFNGDATLLFRHPSPPPEFVSLSSRRGVWAFPGRHESVTANAPAELGGVLTATAMLKPGTRSGVREQAALVIHEAFHVFQRERHPNWGANELELFVYPFEDAEALSLRRLETLGLVLAGAALSKQAAACWAAAALKYRAGRYARMPAGSAAYERGTELNEGLASYVEALAAERAGRAHLPLEDFKAGEVRQRAYATGRTLATLLDRFAPGWKQKLEAGDKSPLDVALGLALPPTGPRRCEAAPLQLRDAAERARRDVAALVSRREALRRDFLARPGWMLELIVGGAPLFPQGFDPLNVERVGAREVLHTRYLKLGGGAGFIEIIDRHSLTEGAGAHPLFNGLRRLTVTGLASEPAVAESGGKTTITADDLKAEFTGAHVTRSGRTLVIRLK